MPGAGLLASGAIQFIIFGVKVTAIFVVLPLTTAQERTVGAHRGATSETRTAARGIPTSNRPTKWPPCPGRGRDRHASDDRGQPRTAAARIVDAAASAAGLGPPEFTCELRSVDRQIDRSR